MRPESGRNGNNVYECPDCGGRTTTEVEARICDECGETLVNIGVERDL